ncbi:phage head closure protein [Mangrovicella endophytica]|uniref:phage head closure protein n=1 Tax=Mangrovicella endophytica TaxID=2066697 RepID=UPI000C9E0C70|nr:phage head closure protein [Mangrovicella endophytica]
MRAGKLDRLITIDAYGPGVPDGGGGSIPSWTPIATLRAQIITLSTEEFLRSYGESSETAIVFRTRFVEGIQTSSRVTYDGRRFNIKEVKELGRRQGLELRCEETGK